VAESVKTQQLIERGDRVVVAVSGGADSVALLSVLRALAPSWNLSLRVAHFNYGLRGTESEEDAAFVRRVCERLDVPCVSERLTLTEDLRKGRSLQEAAREARYAALLRISASVGAHKIALGHTRDDQAETVIMWLLRGAGTTGLSGMPSMRSPFIRPLLAVDREEVLSYVMEQGLEFREDSSNAKAIYMRNRVRHDLLPVLKRFNPAIVGVLTRQAEILREENTCLETIAADQFAHVVMDVRTGACLLSRTGLLALPLALQRRVLRKAVQHVTGLHRGPSFTAISTILNRVVCRRSGSCATVRNVEVSREYDAIRFQCVGAMPGGTTETRNMAVPLPIPAIVSWPLTGQRLQADLVHCCSSETKPLKVPPTQAMLDADRLTLDLRVRAWAPGDRFQPFGLKGHQKKLQDFFADRKVPRIARARIPLIVAPEGIVWVAGYRADHRFRVTASTTRVLRLTLWDGDDREIV
jgi:tRNA(Ile)-lysidine synthase